MEKDTQKRPSSARGQAMRKISHMLLSRRRPDATRRQPGALAETHQLPPRPSTITGTGGVTSGAGQGGSGSGSSHITVPNILLAANAGRIVADGSEPWPDSSDDDDDDDDDNAKYDDGHDDERLDEGGYDGGNAASRKGRHKDGGHGKGRDAGKCAKRRHRRPRRPPNKPCARCAAINFPRLLDWRPGQARPWTSLAHVFYPPLSLSLSAPSSSPSLPASTTSGTPKTGLSPLPSPSPSASSFSSKSSLAPSHASSLSSSGSSRSQSHTPATSRAPSYTSSSSSSRSPSHPPSHRVSGCPYCVFFRAMLGPGADVALGGKFTPYLRIRQAFERLQGVSERHPLARSVLVEVATRHRALPWGYLVKALNPDDDKDGDAHVAAYRAGEGVPARIRGRVVTPVFDPAVARCWLDFCKDTHAGTCGAAEPPISGLRLIDCQERRVVCFDDLEAQAPLEYVALSYVWGQQAADAAPLGEDFSLDSDARALPDSLPAVFADAVTLTKSLGLRYLWIDRFCFLPLDAAERKRQVGLLGDIFSSATLTIIAASGEGIQDGIAGMSVARECRQLSLKTERGLFTTTLPKPDADVAASTWAGRAWTFQEGLLSRRRLVMGPSQAYFQCRELHCHESVALPLRLAPGVDLGRVFPSDRAARRPARLREHVQAFMARDMARAEDRLDAFRGVLRAFSRIDGLAVDNFLGLPLFHPDAFVNVPVVSQTDRLAVGLGWIPDRASGPSPGSGSGSAEPCYQLADGAAFPSWTWLAWRRRQGRSFSNRVFHFNLVGEASPIIDGACSAPRMEMSVGFVDGTVLSWEIDGEAVARRSEPVAFLRLETYSAELRLRLESRSSWVVDHDDNNNNINNNHATTTTTAAAAAAASASADVCSLSPHHRRVVEAMVRADPPPCPPPSSSVESLCPALSDVPLPPSEHRLVLLLVSGRGWRRGGTATALVCRHRDWDPAKPLVRLGALSIEHAGFASVADPEALAGQEHSRALLKGAASAGSIHDADDDLRLLLREVDLY